MSVRGMRMRVLAVGRLVAMVVIAPFAVLMLMVVMLVLVTVRMPMLVSMPMGFPMTVLMFVPVIAMLAVGRAAVDVEFYALDLFPLGAVVVHVEVAEPEFAQLPFHGAGLHAEVDERADHHVAANARDAVEIESFHA